MLRLPCFAEMAAAFHFRRHTMNSRLLSRTFAYRFWCAEGGVIGSIVEKCVPGFSKEENIRESDRYWMILHWMQLRFGIDAAIDVEVLIYGCCSEFAGSPRFCWTWRWNMFGKVSANPWCRRTLTHSSHQLSLVEGLWFDGMTGHSAEQCMEEDSASWCQGTIVIINRSTCGLTPKCHLTAEDLTLWHLPHGSPMSPHSSWPPTAAGPGVANIIRHRVVLLRRSLG